MQVFLKEGMKKQPRGGSLDCRFNYFFVVFLRFTIAEAAMLLTFLLLEEDVMALLAAVATFEEVLTEFSFFTVFTPLLSIDRNEEADSMSGKETCPLSRTLVL